MEYSSYTTPIGHPVSGHTRIPIGTLVGPLTRCPKGVVYEEFEKCIECKAIKGTTKLRFYKISYTSAVVTECAMTVISFDSAS